MHAVKTASSVNTKLRERIKLKTRKNKIEGETQSEQTDQQHDSDKYGR